MVNKTVKVTGYLAVTAMGICLAVDQGVAYVKFPFQVAGTGTSGIAAVPAKLCAVVSE